MSEQLTAAQLRALRILDAYGEVRESNHTNEDAPCVSWQAGASLVSRYLADKVDRLVPDGVPRSSQSVQTRYRIRAKGRQALREAEPGPERCAHSRDYRTTQEDGTAVCACGATFGTDGRRDQSEPEHTDHSDRRVCQGIGCLYGDHPEPAPTTNEGRLTEMFPELTGEAPDA
jgi:hypothetical protein